MNSPFTREEEAILVECAKDKFVAMETFLKVKPKSGGELIPLYFSTIHRKLEEWGLRTQIVVKGRQVYVTTYYLGASFLDCIEKKNISSCFVNLEGKKTDEVFERAHTFLENLPTKIQPKIKTARNGKISFQGNGTSFYATTCKNDSGEQAANDLGRSLTAQNLHISECGSVVHLDALLEGFYGSIPKGVENNTRVVLEGTGNGAQGSFYERAMSVHDNGKEVTDNVWHYGETSLHFIAWFEHDPYRMDKDPFEDTYIPDKSLKMWFDHEKEHREQMVKYGYHDKEIERAINFIRYVALNEYRLPQDPAGAISSTSQEYPATLKHAFQSTGSSFFSTVRTDNLHQKWKDYNYNEEMPIMGNIFHNEGKEIKFDPDDRGEVMLWRPVVKGWKDRYVIGADCAAGLSDGDYDYACVLDRLDNFVVASVHGHFGPKRLAEHLLGLAVYYDWAFLGWENNNIGHAVTRTLRESDYPNLYINNERAEHDSDYGFNTNRNRNEMLNILKLEFEDQINGIEIPHLEFYKEARSFGYLPGKIKPEGINAHDDTIMGLAVTLSISKTLPDPSQIVKKKYAKPGSISYKVQQLGRERRSSTGLRNF